MTTAKKALKTITGPVGGGKTSSACAFTSRRVYVPGLAAFLFALIQLSLPAPRAHALTEGNLVYSGADVRPVYSTYTVSGWSQPYLATETASSGDLEKGVPTYVVIKSAPSWSARPNEKIMMVLDTQCRLTAQVWNGSAWGPSEVIQGDFTDTEKNTFGRGAYRYFDFAFYRDGSGNDKAIVVFPNAASSVDYQELKYKTWDGSAWDSEETIFGYNGDNNGPVARWIRMESAPLVTRSTEVVMVLLDSRSDITGRVWDGTDWGGNGVREQTMTTGSEANTLRTFDIAYEQLSGKLRAWYSSGGNVPQGATWDGTTQLWDNTTVDAPNMGVDQYHYLAVPQPGSDRIALMCKENGSFQFSAGVWDGGAWQNWTNNLPAAAAPLLTNTDPQGYSFGGAWTNNDKFVLAYLRNNVQNALRTNVWTAGAGWGGENTGPNILAPISYFYAMVVAATSTVSDVAQIAFTSRELFQTTASGTREEQNLFRIEFNAQTAAFGPVERLSKDATLDYYPPYDFSNDMFAYARYSPRLNMRTYGSGGFSQESYAPDSDAAIRYSVVEASTKRDEKVMVTL
ncbi:MAG TPA: hypothetical protein PL037_03490, partial [Elusimicrobiales bacterium]|nr:hypothetical protein [Elusimicrobiales bacterium]